MLLVFAKHLATSYVTCSTTKVYMLAICLMHVSEGCHCSFYIQHISADVIFIKRAFKRIRQLLILKRLVYPTPQKSRSQLMVC